MMIEYEGLRLNLDENVYVPAEDSFLLAENLVLKNGDIVLDIGTGTGILALLAARKVGHVIGTDINPKAIELARENARINGIERVEFIQCDLFPPGEGKFDLVVFNAPYLPTEDNGLLARAWSGGPGGIQVIERFLELVPGHLKPGGSFELVVSSLSDIGRINEIMDEREIEFEIVAKRKLFFEELYVIKGKIFNHSR